MAGRLPPHITFNQIYLESAGEVNAPSLPLCIMGPAMRLETQKELSVEYTGSLLENVDLELSATEVLDNGDTGNADWNSDYGTFPVKIYLKDEVSGSTFELTSDEFILHSSSPYDGTLDIIADIYRDSMYSDNGVISCDDVNYILTDETVDFYNITETADGVSRVYVGDYVECGTSEYQIIKIQDKHTLYLDSNHVSPYNPPGNGETGYYIKHYLQCKILATYRALRNDIAAQVQALTLTNFEDVLGESSIYNPLAYAAYKAFTQGNATVYAIPVGGETLDDLDWASALDEAAKHRLYSMVPLSQLNSVRDLLIAHINSYSTADEKKWRLLIFSPKRLQTVENRAEGNGIKGGDKRFDVSTITSGDLDDVLPGDVLILDPEGTPSEYVIASVDTTSNYITTVMTIAEADAEDYKIEGRYSQDEIAENLQELGKSIHNMRILLVQPDTVKDNDTDNTRIAGYYLCAAIGQQNAVNPPATPFTKLPIYGFSGVYGTSDFYTREELLNIIAEGGIYIVTQRTSGAPLECREQLTTFPEEDKKGQLSIVRAVDYGSYVWCDALDPYVGRYNIDQGLLSQLRLVCSMVRDFLVTAVPPVAGIATKVLGVTQDAVHKTHVNISLKWDPLYPGNVFDVDLFI